MEKNVVFPLIVKGKESLWESLANGFNFIGVDFHDEELKNVMVDQYHLIAENNGNIDANTKEVETLLKEVMVPGM